MQRLALTTLAGLLGIGMLAASPDSAAAQSSSPRTSEHRMHSDSLEARRHAPPGSAYKKVSGLVPLPDFVPGLGTLYVVPATLPAGPFLAYDHRGNLVSSIYMIPLKDMNAQKGFSDLKAAHEPVDHVDIVFNAGHPGVAEPHYHVIVWYISAARAAELAK